MSSPFVLFEISWEVCNMVGGIHTVLSTKAKTATQALGDDYIAVGPWMLSESDREVPFDDEPGHEEFCETCRSQGIPVRVGRWRIPGQPRTILVEFSRLYEHKDDVLSELWKQSGVDSISGGWDYVEPVLFGHAAGMGIERWWEEHLAPQHRRAVVHAHEWMTGSSLLYLKHRLPSIGTVFTTHATMLGRALSSLGHSPEDGLGDRTPKDLAEEHNVVAKHSIEGVCAREADVFTTVSEVTAAEAELLHERRPQPLLPNGMDLSVIDEIAGPSSREQVRKRIFEESGWFLGEDISDATLCCVSGRYEFHNKGIDVVLEALAELNQQKGARLVLYILVPAGNSGIRSEVMERRGQPLAELDGPVGVVTHNLFDEEHDPVQEHCQRLGLDNAAGSRVKVIQVPIYLGKNDRFLGEPYEAVLRAMDLSCFPSYYEPWGYTPQESLAVGVPTVTSDYAGFGRWAIGENLDQKAGITVLPRVHQEHTDVVSSLVTCLEGFLAQKRRGKAPRVAAATCRKTAARTAWGDLFQNYQQAYQAAMQQVQQRLKEGVPQTRRPKRILKVEEVRATTPRLSRFEVTATLPESLHGLRRLAQNFWWCWDPEATSLFAELAPDAWQGCRHNPVALLQQVDADVLSQKAAEPDYLARLDRALARLESYLTEDRRPGSSGGSGDDEPVLTAEHPVAYFSAEFGIHESLPIYSGGLGVLAGDHLKSASDLGLPLVGVGLFYRMGYMEQRLTANGEQTEVDRKNDPREMAMECVRTAEGVPLEVKIQLPSRELFLRAWRVRVGRVSLYLLDANTPSNREEDRDITRNLYGGDEEMRLQQEIVLGRGGARLLRLLGIRPSVYHINEGHAAFLTLERVARLVREEGLTFGAAREIVRATTVFTTHTPVPAGHDRFSEDLMRRYFSDAEEWVGATWERFFGLGQTDDGLFNMTWLAMSFASVVNGVSKLHGVASRGLLQPFWPGLFEEEVPIRTVTNGIHLGTWTHKNIVRLMAPESERPITGEDFTRRAPEVEPDALWGARQEMKRELITRAKASLEQSFVSRNDSPVTLHRMLEGLREDSLLIGFARRFAPYKRAHLMFGDIERLMALVNNEERPVRILVAGKAHPRDEHGKNILREIAGRTRGDELLGKVFFLENYDMDLARALVQGVDVWLNNPIRMQEASGTSGMKAAANGALNLSIGDGWWPEAHDVGSDVGSDVGRDVRSDGGSDGGSDSDVGNGWTIAGERVYEDQELQNQFDAAALYHLLEEEVVPLFFSREDGDVPRGWAQRMVQNFVTVPSQFNTDRMVSDYHEMAYQKLAANYREFTQNRKAKPKRLAREARRIRRHFDDVKVIEAHIADLSEIQVGESIEVRLQVDLGKLRARDVQVELVLGHAQQDSLKNPVSVPLTPAGEATDSGKVGFEGSYKIESPGHYAHGLRIRARRGDEVGGTLGDLVFWA